MKKYDYMFFGNDDCSIRLLHDVKCYDHLHFQTELAIALSGELIVKHENSEIVLHKGEAVFIMPYEMHAYSAAAGTDAVIIVFNGMQFDELCDKSGFGGVKFEISDRTAEYVAALAQKACISATALKAAVYPILNYSIITYSLGFATVFINSKFIFRESRTAIDVAAFILSAVAVVITIF